MTIADNITITLASLAYLRTVIRKYLDNYSRLLSKANKLGKAGLGIRSSIFRTKNKLIGILARFKSGKSDLAVNVPAYMTVSNIIKVFGK